MSGVLIYYRDSNSWWFRFFGYGMVGHIAASHRPMFSERIGSRKFLRLGKWKVGVLKP